MEQEDLELADEVRLHAHRRELNCDVQHERVLARLLPRLLHVLHEYAAVDRVREGWEEEVESGVQHGGEVESLGNRHNSHYELLR